MHIHNFWEDGVERRIACDKKAVGNKLECWPLLLRYVNTTLEERQDIGKLLFPRGLIGNDTAIPPIITIHRSIIPTSKVEEMQETEKTEIVTSQARKFCLITYQRDLYTKSMDFWFVIIKQSYSKI